MKLGFHFSVTRQIRALNQDVHDVNVIVDAPQLMIDLAHERSLF